MAKIVAAYSQIDIKKAQEYPFDITNSQYHTPSKIAESKEILFPSWKKEKFKCQFFVV